MNLKSSLINRLKKEFPKIRFTRATLITKGWDHNVLVLDDKVIIRFIKEKRDKSSFERETEFLKYFSKISNLKVPSYLFLSKDKSFGGYEVIRGKELTAEIFKHLNQRQKNKLIQDLAKFLNILHTITHKRAEELGFKKYISWTKAMRDKQKWFRTEFEPKVSKRLTTRENTFIFNFISSFCKSRYSFTTVLGHYDLSHDHIIMNNNGMISGIIDFGDLSVQDPAQEFNGFYDYDEKLPQRIYHFYKGPKDKDFLKRSKQHYIDRWIYLLYESQVTRINKELWKEARKKINGFISSQGSKK